MPLRGHGKQRTGFVVTFETEDSVYATGLFQLHRNQIVRQRIQLSRFGKVHDTNSKSLMLFVSYRLAVASATAFFYHICRMRVATAIVVVDSERNARAGRSSRPQNDACIVSSTLLVINRLRAPYTCLSPSRLCCVT